MLWVHLKFSSSKGSSQGQLFTVLYFASFCHREWSHKLSCIELEHVLFSWSTEMRCICIKAKIIYSSIVLLSSKGLYCSPFFDSSWFVLILLCRSWHHLFLISLWTKSLQLWTRDLKYAWRSPENVIFKGRMGRKVWETMCNLAWRQFHTPCYISLCQPGEVGWKSSWHILFLMTSQAQMVSGKTILAKLSVKMFVTLLSIFSTMSLRHCACFSVFLPLPSS